MGKKPVIELPQLGLFTSEQMQEMCVSVPDAWETFISETAYHSVANNSAVTINIKPKKKRNANKRTTGKTG